MAEVINISTAKKENLTAEEKKKRRRRRHNSRVAAKFKLKAKKKAAENEPSS